MQGFNLSVLFLNATLPLWLGIVLPIAALAVGGFVGLSVYKSTVGKKVGSAKTAAAKITSDAQAEADRIKAQG